MSDKESEFDPDWTIHPGVHWAEAIDESGRVQREIAEAMGISEKHLSQICNGNAMPSAKATVAFAQVMGLPVQMWWNLVCNHQLALALGKKDLTQESL